ncbi:membrane dipeptidase [Amycolatopsis rubida]|uniref:Zn-dependent dipeptidase, dipeptidase homolog n=1 Tax=Amycolatopsis rubida TaxID=112413 RepID=A0A1I5YX58_9PSEU|nr:membrane dipeptidase [Amycolatopsis rubida]SFQ48792.1 Zn-dependent dipeptidase, dipeptidase homolog [Amycolatopsis rubida]
MDPLEHGDLTVVDGLQINNWDRKVLEELKAGGVTGVNATCAVWEGPQETLRAVADWYELARDNADLVVLAENADDIRQAKRDGRLAVLLGFQNSSPFGDDYRMVEVFHRLGVRIAQLTYNIQNLVGGACYDDHDSGLTAYGRFIVAEMNRVGMLVDLSHVGNRTSRDAIDASAGPVAITHANPLSFADSPRNKPDDVIDALAARGGVLGCCLYPNVIGGEKTTRRQFCEMVAGLVERIGPDHVALGSDCTRNWSQDYVAWLRNGRWRPASAVPVEPQWPVWPTWFGGPADFPVLTEGLLEVGLDETVVAQVLGGNWLRLFDTVFPGAGQ